MQIEKHSIPTLTQPFCHGSFVEEEILEVPLQQKQKLVSMAHHGGTLRMEKLLVQSYKEQLTYITLSFLDVVPSASKYHIKFFSSSR